MNPVLVDWLTLLLAPLGIVSLAVAFPARSRAIRNGTSAPRWSKIAQLAHAFLAIVRADEHARHPAPDTLVPHLQRNPAPVHHPHRPARPRHGPPARLVPTGDAATRPIPVQPLPTASRSDMKITNYHWSTNARQGVLTWPLLPDANCGSGGRFPATPEPLRNLDNSHCCRHLPSRSCTFSRSPEAQRTTFGQEDLTYCLLLRGLLILHRATKSFTYFKP